MVLPDKQTVTTLPTPPEGTKQWWSGAGDDYARPCPVRTWPCPRAARPLTSANYNIEEDYDYAYFEVECRRAAASGQLPTTAVDPDAGTDADEIGIDGVSDGYVPATYDLTPTPGRPSASAPATSPTVA